MPFRFWDRAEIKTFGTPLKSSGINALAVSEDSCISTAYFGTIAA
jgi:hypothetical protein